MASETLGDRVRELRDKAGISQRHLARLAGLKSERHIGLIESGERDTLTTDTLAKVATALGCTIGWLMAGEGRAPSVKRVRAAIEAAGKRVGNEPQEATG